MHVSASRLTYAHLQRKEILEIFMKTTLTTGTNLANGSIMAMLEDALLSVAYFYLRCVQLV